MDNATICAQLIENSKSIVVLTGAGISTKAGIPDFRGPKGLYITQQYDPDKVFNIDYFYQDPSEFYKFARDFIQLEESIEPTFTHLFLAQLEAQENFKGIVTQNIDGLHQKAGSKKVNEIHGSFLTAYCVDCNNKFSYEEVKEILNGEDIAHCECSGVIKPDIVFFGENVKKMEESIRIAEEADLFFVIGTSCVVYPAAMLPQYVKGQIIVVNLSPVELPGNVVLEIQNDIDEFFEQVKIALNHETKN